MLVTEPEQEESSHLFLARTIRKETAAVTEADRTNYNSKVAPSRQHKLHR